MSMYDVARYRLIELHMCMCTKIFNYVYAKKYDTHKEIYTYMHYITSHYITTHYIHTDIHEECTIAMHYIHTYIHSSYYIHYNYHQIIMGLALKTSDFRIGCFQFIAY